MDAAPLTTAHELARAAVNNTLQTPQAAVEKHRTAAGEFAKAAIGVDDSEALRVLALLEQHHQRLAQIIDSRNDVLQIERQTGEPSRHREETVLLNRPIPSRSLSESAPTAQPEISSKVSSQASVQRRQGRDISSSIATDLATARGIPGSQSRRGQTLVPGSKDQPSRHGSRQPLRDGGTSESPSLDTQPRDRSRDVAALAPRDTVKSSASLTGPSQSATASNAQGNDAFQKFYNTFEGLLTRISAPLAFAGLPLIPEEAKQQEPITSSTAGSRPSPSLDLTTIAASSTPDITKIFSKAALRAVKDDHGSLGVQESFFVVPTGGGTVSYAGVLSRAERQARHQSLEATLEEGTETAAQQATDPSALPLAQPAQGSKKELTGPQKLSTKTTEELEIENESLKQLTDNLSRRLYMWEKSAQSQSLALQQSIRNLQPPVRPARDGSGTSADAPGPEEEESRELLEQLKAAQKELERFGRENEKLTAVVLRYRQRWEKLKEGARVRREGTLKMGDKDAQQVSEDSPGTPQGG